jgi:hypothetical protein
MLRFGQLPLLEASNIQAQHCGGVANDVISRLLV